MGEWTDDPMHNEASFYGGGRNNGAYLCPSCKGPTCTYDDFGPTDFCECENCGCCFTVDVTTIPED